ncbi:DUF1376 domain-containing protein [Ferrovum myxofaciens]|uniref:DUF1376 domain-containing protein n=1 Tax=Ferrovum myxofaciens TaxID=416213 RepID=UPI000A5C8A19|nr:DUF1376 domain-containing protein [Ferrovum myxofaciens]
MSKITIWMPFYIADYLADTTRLTTEQHGAYLLLIMDYWRNGPLPDDDLALANITRLNSQAWKKNRSAMVRMFQLSEGSWCHKRIDEERSRALSNQSSKSRGGKAGSSAKWGSLDHNKATRSERLTKARQIASHTSEEWLSLLDVCKSSCQKCGSTSDLVKDHILPVYKGGSDGIDNLQPLCRSCNAAKGPDETDYRPLKWKECLTERLSDAYLTPVPSPSPSPSSSLIHTHLNQNHLAPSDFSNHPEPEQTEQMNGEIPDSLEGEIQPNPTFQRKSTPGVTFDQDAGKFVIHDQRLNSLWRQAYPAINIEAELNRAAVWLIANPKNKKSNYARFIGSWFSKAQDRAPAIGKTARTENFENRVYVGGPL